MVSGSRHLPPRGTGDRAAHQEVRMTNTMNPEWPLSEEALNELVEQCTAQVMAAVGVELETSVLAGLEGPLNELRQGLASMRELLEASVAEVDRLEQALAQPAPSPA